MAEPTRRTREKRENRSFSQFPLAEIGSFGFSALRTRDFDNVRARVPAEKSRNLTNPSLSLLFSSFPLKIERVPSEFLVSSYVPSLSWINAASLGIFTFT